MNPFRCSNCDKLLGLIEGKAEIKCPKCKAMNIHAGINKGIEHKAWYQDSEDEKVMVFEAWSKTK